MNINTNKVMALLLTIIPISTFLSIGTNKIMNENMYIKKHINNIRAVIAMH